MRPILLGARIGATALLVGCSLLSRPSAVLAQRSCLDPDSLASRDWAPPLDKAISLSGRDVPLRDALARLSATADVRLSYSADLLPLDQRVCITPGRIPLGDALRLILRDVAVEPVVVAADHVVLAPTPGSPASYPLPGRPIPMLDRIVVTGSATGMAVRPLPVALDVIDGERLERTGTSDIGDALNSAVPGIWSWNSSTSSLLARYGSVRGASSFGLSYPKVYIDGIEVANPLLVTTFIPEAIERVEVIRGPQGAALYGADAIAGVINIVTRHETVDSGASRIRLRSGVGMARSDFSPDATLAQSHTLSYRAGSTARSFRADLSLGRDGEFIPSAYSRRLGGTLGARFVRSNSITTITGRFDAEDAGAPLSPVLAGLLPDTLIDAATESRDPQLVRQFTVGLTSTLVRNDVWTHSVVVGLDGSRVEGVPDDYLPIPSGADAFARIADGRSDRATLRLSSVGQVVVDDKTDVTLTLATEQSLLRQRSVGDSLVSAGHPGDTRMPTTERVEVTSTSGLVAQGTVAFGQLLYLTGGLRLERNLAFARSVELLPMLGAAVVAGSEDATVKVRWAYGKGIRPTRTAARQAVWTGYRSQLRSAALAPEEQGGTEMGIDLALGRSLSFQLTRFDQIASDLIQRVAVGTTSDRSGPAGGEQGRKHIVYALQNVGEIGNHGWELQGSAEAGSFGVSGTLSFVNSVVRRAGSSYSGELRPGDRMLDVPARTSSLSAYWSARDWSATLSAYRASDWISYDRVALTQDLLDSSSTRTISGSALRSYWKEYEGSTHLSATLARHLTRQVELEVSGDNLLDNQLGEPDNVTILPGRTVSLGVRASF